MGIPLPCTAGQHHWALRILPACRISLWKCIGDARVEDSPSVGWLGSCASVLGSDWSLLLLRIRVARPTLQKLSATRSSPRGTRRRQWQRMLASWRTYPERSGGRTLNVVGEVVPSSASGYMSPSSCREMSFTFRMRNHVAAQPRPARPDKMSRHPGGKTCRGPAWCWNKIKNMSRAILLAADLAATCFFILK